MVKRITAHTKYKDEFGDRDRRRCALNYALDIRKFEIELYWKRATYFWTLLAATFLAYFALSASKESDTRLVFLVACIGTILSTGWYLVNRGSKYWQENWERHVDCLEDEFAGPLYKTTISREQFPWLRVWAGYPYSVSKVNQIISLFVTLLWLGIAVSSFPSISVPSRVAEAGMYVLAVGTMVFVILLLYGGRTGPQEDRNVAFCRSGLTNEGDSEAVTSE